MNALVLIDCRNAAVVRIAIVKLRAMKDISQPMTVSRYLPHFNKCILVRLKCDKLCPIMGHVLLTNLTMSQNHYKSTYCRYDKSRRKILCLLRARETPQRTRPQLCGVCMKAMRHRLPLTIASGQLKIIVNQLKIIVNLC